MISQARSFYTGNVLFKRLRKLLRGSSTSSTPPDRTDPDPNSADSGEAETSKIGQTPSSEDRERQDIEKRLASLSLTEEQTARRQHARERLVRQTGVVLKLGRMLMGAGAGAYRVKTSMARLAAAVGIDEFHSQVFFHEVTTTAFASGTFRTELAEQRAIGVNAARIDDLRALVRNLHPHMIAEDIDEKLDEIATRPALYSPMQLAIASGAGCACFGWLNKCGPIDCLAVLIAAFLGQALRVWLNRRKVNHAAVWMLCSILSCSIYVALVQALFVTGMVDDTHQAGIVSAILFLIPGFPLTTAILDLVRFDLVAGVMRGLYVLILMVSAGVGAWFVTSLFSWEVTAAAPDLGLSTLQLYGLNTAATFVAAFCFAVLFNCRPRVAACAALVGAALNPARILLNANGAPSQLMAGIMALLVGLTATAIALRTYYSRVSLSVPAVVIMIPGVPFYRAINALNDGSFMQALGSLTSISFVILAIGVGLAAARMLTDPGWTFEQPLTLPDRLLGNKKTSIH